VDRIEALGPALKDLRMSQEVTQADVAAAMETTHPTTVGAWENSRCVLTVRKLIELLGTYDYQLVFMHKRALDDLVRGPTDE
jgi:transcriptional regulator with XRE-family HTH domain